MINFQIPENPKPFLKVIGVGGGGGNAVNYMHSQNVDSVEFIVCNTDAKALNSSKVPIKIQLGPELTQGLGAGADPEKGKNATEESFEVIKKIIEPNTKMVFITAGMGGGTGTGGAPIIAKLCRQLNILTVGIVTEPFSFEGPGRLRNAKNGIKELSPFVDTLIVISNDKVKERFAKSKMSECYKSADSILATAARCITDIINTKGHVNVDFADVCTVMKNGGHAIMGKAEVAGEDRALKAVQDALNSPLLEDSDISGAKWLLVNINCSTGEHEMSMEEFDLINNYVRKQAGTKSDVILGQGYDDDLQDKISVTVIATGFPTNKKNSSSILSEEELNENPSSEKELLASQDLKLKPNDEISLNPNPTNNKKNIENKIEPENLSDEAKKNFEPVVDLLDLCFTDERKPTKENETKNESIEIVVNKTTSEQLLNFKISSHKEIPLSDNTLKTLFNEVNDLQKDSKNDNVDEVIDLTTLSNNNIINNFVPSTTIVPENTMMSSEEKAEITEIKQAEVQKDNQEKPQVILWDNVITPKISVKDNQSNMINDLPNSFENNSINNSINKTYSTDISITDFTQIPEVKTFGIFENKTDNLSLTQEFDLKNILNEENNNTPTESDIIGFDELLPGNKIKGSVKEQIIEKKIESNESENKNIYSIVDTETIQFSNQKENEINQNKSSEINKIDARFKLRDIQNDNLKINKVGSYNSFTKNFNNLNIPNPIFNDDFQNKGFKINQTNSNIEVTNDKEKILNNKLSGDYCDIYEPD